MKQKSNIVLAALILALFLGRWLTYQVSYHESAVITRFGQEVGVINAGAEDESGLGGPIIRPMHLVHKFDKRLQLLEARIEEQQTADAQNIVVGAYVAWRISDPLAFYRSLQTTEQAEAQIRNRLRDARSVLGTYQLSELTHSDPSQQKLAEAEQKILERLRADLDAQAEQGKPFGITLESVGIQRIVLTQKVAEKVFERMRATRERKAKGAESEGRTAAADIRARAESDKARIMAFANRRAEAIRAEGDAAAARYYTVFKQDEDFAIFLRKLEAYKQVFKNNTTFLLDAKDGLGQEFLGIDPKAGK